MKKILAMIALMLPLAVMAQEKKEAAIDIPAVQNNMRLAAEFSKYGYANHDALSLIQAARMSIQGNFTQAPRKKAEGREVAADADRSGKTGQVSLDAAKLLADAKAFAADNQTLLSLIDGLSTAQGTVRGAVNGPQYAASAVLANDYDLYKVKFRANEAALVIVIGDGDTDLDLYIYDSNGNLIDSDTDYTDDCVCGWTPRWTGDFTIKIVNRGPVYNRYVLNTN